MGLVKILWAERLEKTLFSFLLLLMFFVAAGLSLAPLPFIPDTLFIHFYGTLSFISLLYLPKSYWLLLLLPSLWLDLILQTPLGSHLVIHVLQYGFVFFMEKFLSDYGFLFHWAICCLSQTLLFSLLSPLNLTQTYLTLLIYPFILTWFLKFLTTFKKVANV